MKTIAIVLLTTLLLLPFVYAESNLVYSLTLKYDGASLTNEELKLIEGNAPERLNQPETGFTLKVLDFSGNVLHSFKFLIETVPARDAPTEIFSENGTQISIPTETVKTPTETKTVLVVPYFENAKSIEIFDESDKLMLSVDVSKYSKKSIDFNFVYIVAGIIILIIIAIFFTKFYKKNKPHKTEEAKHKAHETKEDKMKTDTKKSEEEKKKDKFCHKCGNKLEKHHKFCPKCGSKVK